MNSIPVTSSRVQTHKDSRPAGQPRKSAGGSNQSSNRQRGGPGTVKQDKTEDKPQKVAPFRRKLISLIELISYSIRVKILPKSKPHPRIPTMTWLMSQPSASPTNSSHRAMPNAHPQSHRLPVVTVTRVMAFSAAHRLHRYLLAEK